MNILDLCVSAAAIASLIAARFMMYPQKRRYTVKRDRQAPPIDKIPEGYYKITDRNGTRFVRKG